MTRRIEGQTGITPSEDEIRPSSPYPFLKLPADFTPTTSQQNMLTTLNARLAWANDLRRTTIKLGDRLLWHGDLSEEHVSTISSIRSDFQDICIYWRNPERSTLDKALIFQKYEDPAEKPYQAGDVTIDLSAEDLTTINFARRGAIAIHDVGNELTRLSITVQMLQRVPTSNTDLLDSRREQVLEKINQLLESINNLPKLKEPERTEIIKLSNLYAYLQNVFKGIRGASDRVLTVDIEAINEHPGKVEWTSDHFAQLISNTDQNAGRADATKIHYQADILPADPEQNLPERLAIVISNNGRPASDKLINEGFVLGRSEFNGQGIGMSELNASLRLTGEGAEITIANISAEDKSHFVDEDGEQMKVKIVSTHLLQ